MGKSHFRFTFKLQILEKRTNCPLVPRSKFGFDEYFSSYQNSGGGRGLDKREKKIIFMFLLILSFSKKITNTFPPGAGKTFFVI